MSKNVELYLNSDNQESFSKELSDNDDKDEDDNKESEKEKKKKYRMSLENALKNNNYEHAFEKINTN